VSVRPATAQARRAHARPIHRQALAYALACLFLATVAVSAPAATPRDLRSPDARALAQERYYSSYGSPVAATPAPVAEPPGRDGIAPLPFVLALAGAVIVGIGVSTAVQARRRVAA
jgi:hypothetical protein